MTHTLSQRDPNPIVDEGERSYNGGIEEVSDIFDNLVIYI